MAWCYTGVKRKGGLQRWKQRLNGRIDVYRMEKSSLATPLMWSGAVRRSQKGVSTATPIHWPLAMVTLSGVREPGGVLLAFLTGWLPFAGIERQRLKATGVWSSAPQWPMCLRDTTSSAEKNRNWPTTLSHSYHSLLSIHMYFLLSIL